MAGPVLGAALAWYLALLLVTAVGMVPAAVLFSGLGSHGVHLARPFGLALVALLTWLSVHLTPLPYGTFVVQLSFLIVAVYGVVVGIARGAILRPATALWREWLTVEGVAFVVFVVVLLVRVQAPDAWGTEKPADLMLLTAVHRTLEFPPLDPWLAGEQVSYYHLGYVQMDHLARIAGLGPGDAFNLAVATAGSMAAAAAAGLAMDIVRLDVGGPVRAVRRRMLVLAGAVTAAGLLLVAPLVGLVQVLAANGIGAASMWGRLGVEGVPASVGATGLVPDAYWWWWPTTRVLPDVISEYPAFSLILGDPHPHLLGLPLGITALALAVQVFAGATQLSWRRWVARPELLIFTGALFAALAMTNSWDVVTYGAVWAAGGWWAATRAGWPLHVAALVVVRWALLPTVVGLLLAWPFLGALDPAPIGLAWVRGESSDLPRWLLFWLPVVLPAIAGGLFLARTQPVAGPRSIAPVVVLSVPVLAWTGAMVAGGEAFEIVERGTGWLTALLLLAGVTWAGLRALGSAREHRGQETALWLPGAAGVVLLVTEFVHVDDQFPGRMNTAFKFWFHAWVLFAISGGALLALSVDRWLSARADRATRTAREDGASRRVWALRGLEPGIVPTVLFGMAAVLWGATMVTPPLMAVSRAGEGQEARLNAIAHLERPGDGIAAAVAWGLATLDPSQHVVVEAVGESFGDGNRFSASTGVPTVLGWPGHQRQWRAEVREGERRSAVAAIYLGSDAARDRVVREWGVTHVLVGNTERLAFGPTPPIVQAGWPVVFEEGVTQVFEVPESVRQPVAESATESAAP